MSAPPLEHRRRRRSRHREPHRRRSRNYYRSRTVQLMRFPWPAAALILLSIHRRSKPCQLADHQVCLMNAGFVPALSVMLVTTILVLGPNLCWIEPPPHHLLPSLHTVAESQDRRRLRHLIWILMVWYVRIQVPCRSGRRLRWFKVLGNFYKNSPLLFAMHTVNLSPHYVASAPAKSALASSTFSATTTTTGESTPTIPTWLKSQRTPLDLQH